MPVNTSVRALTPCFALHGQRCIPMHRKVNKTHLKKQWNKVKVIQISTTNSRMNFLCPFQVLCRYVYQPNYYNISVMYTLKQKKNPQNRSASLNSKSKLLLNLFVINRTLILTSVGRLIKWISRFMS